jgi:hypothetical protein
MGAPTIEDERLYSFFEDYKAKITDGLETLTSFSPMEKPPLINKLSSLWQPSSRLPEDTAPNYDISDMVVLRHITACFTDGVKSPKNLSRLKVPNVMSRLPYMQKEDEAYDFFLFWLELPTNEWLDAFLFEVAASWKDLSLQREAESKLSMASISLYEVNERGVSELARLLDDDILDEKSRIELSEKFDQYQKNRDELMALTDQMRSIIDSIEFPSLPKTDEAEITDQFYENGFLMRRVEENKKDIRTARYALKDLELGDKK